MRLLRRVFTKGAGVLLVGAEHSESQTVSVTASAVADPYRLQDSLQAICAAFAALAIVNSRHMTESQVRFPQIERVALSSLPSS